MPDPSDGAHVARLVAIGILLWGVFASITYSVENFPQPAEAGAATSRPSPLATIAEVELDPEAPPEPGPGRPAFSAGAYAIGDSPDPKIAARDRDYRPRQRIFVTDERDLDDERDRRGTRGDRADDSRDRSDRDRSDRDSSDRDRDEDDRPDRYLVEGEIEPGLYATAADATDCRFELWRVMRDRSTRIIGEEHLGDGRLLVTIDDLEPDWLTAAESCGDWYRWQPRSTPLDEAGNGDYWRGDLERGIWFVPQPCRWEKVVAFRGVRLSDVVDAGSGPGSLTVDGDTLGVRVRGCRSPMSLSSPEGVYAP